MNTATDEGSAAHANLANAARCGVEHMTVRLEVSA
jgi:hypothetical protein